MCAVVVQRSTTDEERYIWVPLWEQLLDRAKETMNLTRLIDEDHEHDRGPVSAAGDCSRRGAETQGRDPDAM